MVNAPACAIDYPLTDATIAAATLYGNATAPTAIVSNSAYVGGDLKNGAVTLRIHVTTPFTAYAFAVANARVR